MNDTACAYAAGLVDGEGSIFIRSAQQPQKNGKIYRNVHVFVKVSNTDFGVLQWLKDNWGGSIKTYVPRQEGHRPQGEWSSASLIACAFLRDIHPYLRIKLAQADNALAFQATRAPKGRHRLYHPTTEEEWAKVDEFLAKSRALNHPTGQKGARLT